MPGITLISRGTNGELMQPGRPYCQRCDAAFFPTGPRLGEGHIAVRFGKDDQRHFQVIVNGKEHTKCLEAFSGSHGMEGWVIEVDDPCTDCYGGYMCYVRAANVSIQRNG